MAELAIRNITESLDKIIHELDKAVDSKITLTPSLVRDLRDLLTVVRNCAVNLSDAERELGDLALARTAEVFAFPGRHD